MPGSTNRRWLQQGAIWGNMLGKTMLPGDEELGKKDDDHKPGATPRIPTWTYSGTLLRWRRRRLILVVVGLYLVYVLAKNIPALGEWSTQRDTFGFEQPFSPIAHRDRSRDDDDEPTGPPPGTRAPKAGETAPHTYNGPIKFYRLASSLHGASHTNGYRTTNRNVLFAISNLQSASTLLPVVCEMSKWSRNWVHVAFMGREDIPLQHILEINGIDQVKCPVIWHDARPDYTEYSTDGRAETTVKAAFTHIHSFLHPQVAIIDSAESEDDFLVRGVRAKSEAFDMPVIEGPADGWESLMWMARLDSGSLKSWHRPTVEVLIQVPPDSSSVTRLLRSLKTADYRGLNPPHLTIELPAHVDETVEQFLSSFEWPPHSGRSEISIRRRIAHQRATQEDSAIRLLELFYPTNPINSHVLLLSTQAELSSQYYQYLVYVLLEYRYSSFGKGDSDEVMGVSLELPSVLLDGKTKLTTPNTKDMHTSRYGELFSETKSVPFLWQAPNSHATLFFGDKWAELHSFISNRVAKQSQEPKPPSRRKIVSETLPSWMEYMLEFMRARGYSLIYPGATSAASLVTIHNELYHVPEEFSPPKPSDSEGSATEPPKLPDEAFLRADEPASRPKYPELQVVPHSQPLHLVLPFDGDLPEISHLPYLLYNGNMVSQFNVSSTASVYAEKYREVIGGCKSPAGKHRLIVLGRARDLFCFGNEDDDDWELDVPETLEADVVDDYFDTGRWTGSGRGQVGKSLGSSASPTVSSSTPSLTTKLPTPTSVI